MFLRTLGYAVLVNHWLSRVRIYFVPLNWVLILFLGTMVQWGFTQIHEAHMNPQAPVALAVEALAAYGADGARYVSVSGYISTDQLFVYKTGRGSAKTVTRVWAPLFDAEAKTAFLVELADKNNRVVGRHKIAVSGMLRPMDPGLKQEIEKAGGRIDGAHINANYVLAQNAVPGTASMGVGLIVGAALPLGLLLLAAFSGLVGRVESGARPGVLSEY